MNERMGEISRELSLHTSIAEVLLQFLLHPAGHLHADLGVVLTPTLPPALCLSKTLTSTRLSKLTRLQGLDRPGDDADRVPFIALLRPACPPHCGLTCPLPVAGVFGLPSSSPGMHVVSQLSLSSASAPTLLPLPVWILREGYARMAGKSKERTSGDS